MNVLLINNHSVLNAGDYAILNETLALLHAAFPKAQIALSFNDVAPARATLPQYAIHGALLGWSVEVKANGRYGLVYPARRLLDVLGLLLVALVYRVTKRTIRVFRDPEKHALVAVFCAADVVVGCGGGYIYASGPQISPIGWFTFTLLGCMFALVLGKPLVLLPQSIGPLHDQRQQRFVAWIVRRAALVCARERHSLQLLHTIGGAGRALLVPDMALGARTAADEPARRLLAARLPEAGETAFTVGITALNWSGQNHSFGGQERYEQALIECIDGLTAQNGVVVLFAQCCGPSPAEDDRLTNMRLAARVQRPERVVVINDALPPDVLQAAYGRMDYFIGTRMHSVILALNAGVPTIAIGYQHKTQGLFDEMGMADACCEIGTLSGAELLARFEQLRQQPAQPGAHAYIARARRAKRALAALLPVVTERV